MINVVIESNDNDILSMLGKLGQYDSEMDLETYMEFYSVDPDADKEVLDAMDVTNAADVMIFNSESVSDSDNLDNIFSYIKDHSNKRVNEFYVSNTIQYSAAVAYEEGGMVVLYLAKN